MSRELQCPRGEEKILAQEERGRIHPFFSFFVLKNILIDTPQNKIHLISGHQVQSS